MAYKIINITDKETCFNDVNGANVKLGPNEEMEHPCAPLGGYRKLKIEEINSPSVKKKKDEQQQPKVENKPKPEEEKKMEDDK